VSRVGVCCIKKAGSILEDGVHALMLVYAELIPARTVWEFKFTV
jgi:hypothetical protein